MHKKRNWRRKVTTTRSRGTAISSIQCGYSIRHGGHRISLYCIHVSLTCVWVRPTKCVLTEMRWRCPALMTSAQLDRAPENGQRLIYLITDEQIHSVQPLSAVQLMNPISQRVFTPAETCQLIESIVNARYPASISVRQCSAKVIFSRRSRERPLRRQPLRCGTRSNMQKRCKPEGGEHDGCVRSCVRSTIVTKTWKI